MDLLEEYNLTFGFSTDHKHEIILGNNKDEAQNLKPNFIREDGWMTKEEEDIENYRREERR